MNTEILLSWQAPSNIDHDRSHHWHIIAGTVAISLIVYGILSGNWTFSFCIGLLAGLFVLTRDHAHPTHEIAITTAGIIFDRKLHQWTVLNKFWILTTSNHAVLHISTKKRLQPNIKILINDDIDPTVILQVLSQFLPHDATARESVFDFISRICKL